MASRAAPRSPAKDVGPPRADFVDALAKGLQLLAAFEHAAALGNGELAELTGLPKATVSRLCGTLVTLGYLERDAHSRKYVVGARVLGLGATLERDARVQRMASPPMQQFARAYGLNVALGTRDGTHVLLLEVARPPRDRLQVSREVGSHVPLASTSLGLACLVALPVGERARVIELLRRSHRGDWTRVRQRVERAHAERARQRFVVLQQSREVGVSGVAVPLVVDRGRSFAFAAVGPTQELPRPRLTQIVGPALADLVDGIARELGGSVAGSASPARVPGRPPP